MSQSNLKHIRPSAYEGRFYPSLPVELKNLVLGYLKNKEIKEYKKPLALVVPHAGYVFSGQTAAYAFAQLNPSDTIENIFLIGTSHNFLTKGMALSDYDAFETPLGKVLCNKQIVDSLVKFNPEIFYINNTVHDKEHSLEVQLPFLQAHLKNNFNIVPILTTTNNINDCKKAADALKPYFNSKNLFIFSTDLSHYPSYDDATQLDNELIQIFLKQDIHPFYDICEKIDYSKNIYTRACGSYALLILLYLTQQNQDGKFELIHYCNSGDSPYGDKDRVVGYSAIAYFLNNKEENLFSENQKRELLAYARKSIEYYLKQQEKIKDKPEDKAFDTPMGVFVSLYKSEELRGCIGTFSYDNPLWQNVRDMAIASATRDFRFEPLTLDEIKDIRIEISVLTPLKKIKSINEIELGRHGIYIKKGWQSGTFLPQVATKTRWTLEEFLGHCARDKAGIGWDEWKDADIYTYEAMVFSE